MLNFKKITEIVHLIMVHSYKQIFMPPLRILFNVIQTVSGGVRIQIPTYLHSLRMQINLRGDFRLEKIKITMVIRPLGEELLVAQSQ